MAKHRHLQARRRTSKPFGFSLHLYALVFIVGIAGDTGVVSPQYCDISNTGRAAITSMNPVVPTCCLINAEVFTGALTRLAVIRRSISQQGTDNARGFPTAPELKNWGSTDVCVRTLKTTIVIIDCCSYVVCCYTPVCQAAGLRKLLTTQTNSTRGGSDMSSQWRPDVAERLRSLSTAGAFALYMVRPVKQRT